MPSQKYLQEIALAIPPSARKSRYLQELQNHLEDAEENGQKNPEKTTGKPQLLIQNFIMSEKNNIIDSLHFFTFSRTFISSILFIGASLFSLSTTTNIFSPYPVEAIASILLSCLFIFITFFWYRILQTQFLTWGKTEISDIKIYKYITFLPAVLLLLFSLYLTLTNLTLPFIGYRFVFDVIFHSLFALACLSASYFGLFSTKKVMYLDSFIQKMNNKWLSANTNDTVKKVQKWHEKYSFLFSSLPIVYISAFILYRLFIVINPSNSYNNTIALLFAPLDILSFLSIFCIKMLAYPVYNTLSALGIASSTGITFLHVLFSLIVGFLILFFVASVFSFIKKMWKMGVVYTLAFSLIFSFLFFAFNQSTIDTQPNIPFGSKSLTEELKIQKYGKLNLFSYLVSFDFLEIHKNNQGKILLNYTEADLVYNQIFDISSAGELVLEKNVNKGFVEYSTVDRSNERSYSFDENILCENEKEIQDAIAKNKKDESSYASFVCINPTVKNTKTKMEGKFSRLFLNSSKNYVVGSTENSSDIFFRSVDKLR